MHASFCNRLPVLHTHKFLLDGSSGSSVKIKSFHCASVMNAEGEATEPRLTLKQMERKKFEKRSKYKKLL